MGIFNIKSLKDKYLSHEPVESPQKRQEPLANEQDSTIKGGVSRLAAIRDSSLHQEMSASRLSEEPNTPKKRAGEDVQTLLEQSTAAGTDLIEVVTDEPTGNTAPVPATTGYYSADGQEPTLQDEPASAPVRTAYKSHHPDTEAQSPHETSSKGNTQKTQSDSHHQVPVTNGDAPALGAMVSPESSSKDGGVNERVVLVPSAYGLDVPPPDTDSVDLPNNAVSKADSAQHATLHQAPHVMTSEMATNHRSISEIPSQTSEPHAVASGEENPEKVTLVQGVYGMDIPQEAGENLDTPTRGVPAPTASVTSSPEKRRTEKNDADTPEPVLVRGVYGLDVPESSAGTGDSVDHSSVTWQDFPGPHAQVEGEGAKDATDVFSVSGHKRIKQEFSHGDQVGSPQAQSATDYQQQTRTQLSSRELEREMLAGEETVELAPIHVREALEAQRAAQKASFEETASEAEPQLTDTARVAPVQQEDTNQQEPRKVTTASFSLSPQSVGEVKNRVLTPSQSAGSFEAVFVCTGNVARSASAEVIAQSLASQYGLEGNWVFTSAGTAALAGSSIYKYIGSELEGRGYDPSQFRAKQLTAEMVERATLLLVAEQDHADWILREWPQYHTKVHLMKQVARIRQKASRRAEPLSFIYGYTEAAHGADSIADPYRRGRTACRVAVDEVEQALQVILPWLVRARV